MVKFNEQEPMQSNCLFVCLHRKTLHVMTTVKHSDPVLSRHNIYNVHAF